MGRRKVKLELIRDYSIRRRTYQKRSKGLIKKISELKVLCDIDTCVVLYNPFDNKPAEIWPNNKDDVREILARY